MKQHMKNQTKEKSGIKLQGILFNFLLKKGTKIIEFINNRLKDYAVLDQTFHNSKINHNLIALSICGLYNYKLGLGYYRNHFLELDN
jgi:hypothetical protein